MTTLSTPRPSADLMVSLRRGKEALHAAHRALPLHEKVRMVIDLQGFALAVIALRRPLEIHERQWPVDDQNAAGRVDNSD